MGLFKTRLGPSSEGQCGPYTDQELPRPSDYIVCGFVLFAPDGPDEPIISPPDSHYHPGANLSLSCHAASNPPAQFSWAINGGPQQPTQELFIPNISANDSGSYTCLAHNPDTGLSRTTVKMITVSGKCLLDHRHQASGYRSVWFSEKSLEDVISCPVAMDTSKSPTLPLTLPLLLCRHSPPLALQIAHGRAGVQPWKVRRGFSQPQKAPSSGSGGGFTEGEKQGCSRSRCFFSP